MSSDNAAAIRQTFNRWPRMAGLGMLFGLYLVWQIPNVIALRYFLLLALCVFFLVGGSRSVVAGFQRSSWSSSGNLVFLSYFLFLFWLLVVAIGIAAEPARSLWEIKGQWLPPTLCLLIGYGASMGQRANGYEHGGPVVRTVFWALVAHAVLQLVAAAWTVYQHGDLPATNFGGISDHKANVTYTNAMAFSLLLADMIRGPSGERLLRLGPRVLAFVFAVLFLSTYVSGARNGVIVFLLMTVFAGAVVALRRRKNLSGKGWTTVALCLALLLAGSWIAVKTDARWQRFVVTVPVGWDIDSSHAWVNRHEYPIPRAADGGPIDVSAYERIAFTHAALRFVAENPLGTEVSRDAFKRLVSLKYSRPYSGHSHNSYLDLAISAGLPGLALWICFLGALLWTGYRCFSHEHSAAGLALVLVAMSFALRSLLDSIVRDHIVQEFMMTCGVLLGCLAALGGKGRKENVIVPG